MNVGISLFVFLFGICPLMFLLEAYVLTVIWGWFIVPAFGLPSLAITTAIGITILMSMLTNHQVNVRPEPGSGQAYYDVLTSLTIKSLSKSLTILFVGWVTTLFM